MRAGAVPDATLDLPAGLASHPASEREWRGGGRFRFLSSEHDLGWPIDWRGGPSRLWNYHLHYLDALRESGVGGDERLALLDAWIAANPPGSRPGWEAYPISLRLVNALGFLAGRPVHEVRSRALAVQAYWLEANLERDLGANHLWKNAVALAWAGRCFRGADAARWRATGDEEVRRALREQVLDDGFHYERSPGYHALFVEDLLRLDALTRSFDADPLAGPVRRALERACGALASVLHQDGDIPLFNDAAFGQAAPASTLLAAARAAGVVFEARDEGAPVAGFHRIDAGPATLIVDAGEVACSEQPGHAHADTLSFELSAWGRRVVVDAGVFDYGATAERRYARSTAAHNTLELDGHDSSEVWSVFRVGRRARPFDVRRDAAFLEAAHDGYRHLPGSPVHRRRLTVEGPGSIRVDDAVQGKGRHRATSRLRLHPDFELVSSSGGDLVARAGELEARVERLDGALVVERVPYFPRFGERHESLGVRLEAEGELELRVGYRLVVSRSDSSSAS